MTLAPQVSIAVSEASQVGEARRAATRMARGVGFDEQARGEVAIVATELATNLARHARDGRLLLAGARPSGGPTLEMLSVDAGPGMADVQRCLQDGYSTRHAGQRARRGAAAVERVRRPLDRRAGTVVVSRLCRPATAPAAGVRRRFDVGAPSRPGAGEEVCGDTWRIAERDGDCAVHGGRRPRPRPARGRGGDAGRRRLRRRRRSTTPAAF